MCVKNLNTIGKICNMYERTVSTSVSWRSLFCFSLSPAIYAHQRLKPGFHPNAIACVACVRLDGNQAKRPSILSDAACSR